MRIIRNRKEKVKMNKQIALYSVEQFDGMRQAGRLAALTLDYIRLLFRALRPASWMR